MRASVSISLLVLVFTTNLWADLQVRYYSIGNNYKRPFSEVLIRQDRVRINQSPRAQSYVMIDLGNGDIVQLDTAKERYFLVNAQTLSQYASFYQNNKSMLQGLIDHGLQQLAPDKRAQVERLMEDFDASSKNLGEIRIVRTKKTEPILGVECTVFAIHKNRRLQSEICISHYQQLGLAPGDIKSIEMLKEFALQFRHSAPLQQRGMLDMLSRTVLQIKGLPMKQVSYASDGKVSGIIQAGSISFKSIQSGAYSIPRHYEQQNLPSL